MMNIGIRSRFAAIAAAALLAFGPGTAGAIDVYLSLSSHGQRIDLGVAGFAPATPTIPESSLGRKLQDVLRYDLLSSRYFNIVEDGPVYNGREAELRAWEGKDAEMLVCGKLKLQNGQVSLTGQLYDVESRQVIWEKEFSGPESDYRHLAHLLNDEIIFRFTGEKGLAHTRIVFSNDKTGHKELFSVDYDGQNLRQLTKDNSINILPKWSPDGGEIIYTTYKHNNPDLYCIAPDGGNCRPVSRQQGLNTAATYSPDGKRIVLTITRGEAPKLYLLERATGNIIRQLTRGNSIETSPTFAPNGREIAYVSDVPGFPQLYIMSLEGGNVRRLPAPGYCDSPAWSPRGDKIVFTMRQGRGDNKYDLYLYDLATSRVTRLTQNEGNNENPSWSPDGRFIAFSSSRAGKNSLAIIAVDGSGLRRLGDIPGNSRTPHWSP